jgi:hypothetical protein
MIYCGSGSYFEKFLVPVPAPLLVLIPVPVPVPVPPDLFITVFNNRKFVQNRAFSMPEAALFSRIWIQFFYLLL